MNLPTEANSPTPPTAGSLGRADASSDASPARGVEDLLSPRSPDQRAFLVDVEGRLDLLLRVDPDADDEPTERLIEAGRRLCLAGGKRARPWLVMMLADALEVQGSGRRDLAVCVELIHTASLLHDDVVDVGEQRRGQPTANVLWGNLSAVLAGDLVMTCALAELRPHSPGVLFAAVETVADMSRAAVREAAARGRVDVSLARWRTMAMGKTGALFGLCGRGVGLLAGAEREARRLRRAGEHLGVAFQIADDLDDLVGRAEGKGQQVDLRLGNPSYPLLWAAETKPEISEALAAAWCGREAVDLALLGADVKASGAIEASWQAIGQEIDGLEEALSPWRDHPAIEGILQWARGLWSRAHPGMLTS